MIGVGVNCQIWKTIIKNFHGQHWDLLGNLAIL